MRKSPWLITTQLLIACALTASAALYVHYLDPVASDFCGLDSGCEAVRRSPLAYFGSRFVSLPLLSLVAYSLLFALSLRCGPTAAGTASSKTPRNRRFLEPCVLLFALSGLGGLVALLLVGYQALGLGQFCWLCLIVDGSAVATAGSSFALAWSQRPGTAQPLLRLSAAKVTGTALVVACSPFIWAAVKPPAAVPPGVAELYVPGKINIVEFADFQCPYCRKLHHVLSPLLKQYGDDVHFVRLHRPLARHPMARPAALAAICADKQGRGEEMADKLFQIELSMATIRRSAQSLGVLNAAFEKCLQAPETADELRRQYDRLSEESFQGLPTTYVGQKLMVGVRSEAAYRDAFDRARQPPSQGISGPLFLSVQAILLAGIWLVGGRRGSEAGTVRGA